MPIGPAPSGQALSLDFVLAAANPAALSSFVQQVSNPSSSQYRHFLGAGQFASTFGPTPATISAVTAELRSLGFSPGSVSADGLIIPVQTTVGAASSALSTPIDSYSLVGGGTGIANTSAPQLPSSIASDVVDIVGLDTVTPPQSDLQKIHPGFPGAGLGRAASAITPALQPGQPSGCSSASNVAGTYTGPQLATAYDFSASGGPYAAGFYGQNVTVALFELEPFLQSDVTAFEQCYGISNTPVVTEVDGGAGSGAGSGETDLDIDNILALAPKATLDVYQAPDTFQGLIDNYTKIADDDAAHFISSSWGLCEDLTDSSNMQAEGEIFAQMASQGQTMFAAAGDSGSEACVHDAPAYLAGSGATTMASNYGYGGATYVLGYSNGCDGMELTTIDQAQGGYPNGAGYWCTGADVNQHDAVATTPYPQIPEVYFADPHDNAIDYFDSEQTCNPARETNGDCAVDTFADAGGPSSLAVGYGSGISDDTLYVGNATAHNVEVVSLAGSTPTVVATVPLAANADPTAITLDETSNGPVEVYVADSANDDVAYFAAANCSSNAQSGCPTSSPPTISVGTDPVGLAATAYPFNVYVANAGSDSVSVISVATEQVTTTVNLSYTYPGGSCPEAPTAIVAGDLGVLVTETLPSCGPDGVLSTINLQTNTEVSNQFLTDDQPTAVTSGDGTIGTGIPGSDVVVAGAQYGSVQFFDETESVDDPASQPDVTGVGGTDLTTPSATPAETAWNEALNGNGAGGGGFSLYTDPPSWQTGPGTEGKACLQSGETNGAGYGATGYGCRQVPDVSASADPYNGYAVYWDGGWVAVGGTSGAAPLWAAALAVINSEAPSTEFGLLNPELYELAADREGAFNNVTTGNNDYTGTDDGNYPATTGYNMATGLGTPIVSKLATDLLTPTVAPPPVPKMSVVASPNPASYGQTVSVTATVGSTDDGGTVTFTIAPSATPSDTTGLSGCSGLAMTTTTPYTASCQTSTLAPGSYVLTATYAGDTANSPASATATLTVNPAPTAMSATPALLSESGTLYLFTLHATLTSGGHPLADQPVNFLGGTTSLCANVVTNGSGLATCDASTDLVGVVDVLLADGYTATFAGTTDYASSQTKGPLIG